MTDAANNKVNVWDKNGTFVKSWGEEGNGDGEFSIPTGIATMGNKTVIVGDINSSPTFARIQKFTLSGDYEETIQPESGGFYPRALAVNDALGKIYVCNANSYILIVDTF
ncbi:MAG: hypothetical protein KJ737_27355 [Proteobacteria bacterium]|nr:hypothetical protein [Pseudomonadota bacterium]